MEPPSITKEQILTDIQAIYQHAIHDEKWLVALRAKELQGKILGLFNRKFLPEITRLEDMTEEQLREFLDLLEKHDPDLKEPHHQTPVPTRART